MAITQEGIATSVHSARSTVTKWLRRLAATHRVALTREHVPGRPLRKTVYRLTAEGWMEARGLRSRLETDVVRVRVRVGHVDLVPMRVSQVPEFFPWVDLTYAVSAVRRGVLDLTEHPSALSARTRTGAWGSAARQSNRFFGRTDEIRFLETWVGSMSKVLVVLGLPGIGKSLLVSSWLRRHHSSIPTFWADISSSTTEGGVLASLASFLTRPGRTSLAASFFDGDHHDLGLLARILAEELHDRPAILVLDNVQQATPAIDRLVSEAILPLARTTRTRLVLVSRSLPSFLERGESRRVFTTEILRVGGLDFEASRALLTARGFEGDEAAARRIIASTHGHPLLLSLAATRPSSKGWELRRYLDREIWRSLPVAQKRVLELASVFRHTAPAIPLHHLESGADQALRALESQSLIERTVSGDYFVHDTIRDYVVSRMRKERRAVLHRRAAHYFLGCLSSRERFEALHHLIAAHKTNEAAAFLAAEGSMILDSVSAAEVVQCLRDFPGGDLNPVTACILWESLGDSLRTLGHLTPARLEYRHALHQAETADLPTRVPRLLRKLASIERCQGRIPRALGNLVESQARLSQNPDPCELPEVLRELALVEEAQGHMDAAVAFGSEAVDRATEASEPALLARCLSVLGTLLTQKGNVEQGLQHKLESLRIAERAGNLTEMARSDITVGTSYHELGRFEDALVHYQKGLQIARLIGNLRLTAVAAVNCAVALLDLHRYAEAGQPIEDARRFFGILEEPQMLAVLDINEGQRQMGLGRWALATRTWEKGLRALRKAGDSYELLRSLDDVAVHYSGHGDPDTARDLWREGLRLARRLGNEPRIAALEAALVGTEISLSARPRPSGR